MNLYNIPKFRWRFHRPLTSKNEIPEAHCSVCHFESKFRRAQCCLVLSINVYIRIADRLADSYVDMGLSFIIPTPAFFAKQGVGFHFEFCYCQFSVYPLMFIVTFNFLFGYHERMYSILGLFWLLKEPMHNHSWFIFYDASIPVNVYVHYFIKSLIFYIVFLSFFLSFFLSYIHK